MLDPVAFLAKLSVPLGVATTILGGSAWLTTMHNKVELVEKQVNESNEKIFGQESKLSRIEGKLDILIETIQRRRNETHNDPGSNSNPH